MTIFIVTVEESTVRDVVIERARGKSILKIAELRPRKSMILHIVYGTGLCSAF